MTFSSQFLLSLKEPASRRGVLFRGVSKFQPASGALLRDYVAISEIMKPHRALMIVDVQQAFDPPAEFVEKLRRYSRCFPCRIFTRFVNPAGSLFREVLKQKSSAPGSADTRLLIDPGPDDLVVEKSSYGLSQATLRILRKRKITHVTVCGLDTDACVLGVMFSLFDAGIICHLKEDMCWSSSGLHKPALKIIRKQFPKLR